MHRWKVTGDTEGDVDLLHREFVLNASGLTREHLWPAHGEHEVVYHWDGEAGVVRVPYERRFTVPRTRAGMMGIVDWETDVPVLHLNDLKTGRLFETAPGETLQFLWYGAIAAMHRGQRTGRVALSAVVWPRYPKDNPPRVAGPDFVPVSRLTAFLDDVKRARDVAMSRRAHTLVNPGTWCLFCRSRPYCPAYEFEREQVHR